MLFAQRFVSIARTGWKSYEMKRTKGFDGIRCISILLVICAHAEIIHTTEKGGFWDNISYYYSGGVGAAMFFTLSGFLITSLLLKERQRNGQINIKYFFIRRFLRLLPPIIPFYIAVIIFMHLGYIRDAYWGLAASMAYLYNFIPRAKLFYSAELSHTWTLAVEEQFYITWPLLLSFLSNKRVYILALTILLLSVGAYLIIPTLQITLNGSSYLIKEVFFTNKWTLPAISPIILGSLAAFALHYNREYLEQLLTSAKGGFLVLGVLAFPIFCFGAACVLIPMVFSFGFCFLLIWISVNQDSLLVRILEFYPIKYIGLISYGLYLWQGFFVRSGQGFLPKIWIHDAPYHIPFAFLAAIISYELLEKRVIAYKDRFNVVKPMETGLKAPECTRGCTISSSAVLKKV